ncbi:MAG: CsgG/HfaB family protein [Armatimonadota bacterium]|nr:CsgG/HfaB family protein [Armatimonadota bacterium]
MKAPCSLGIALLLTLLILLPGAQAVDANREKMQAPASSSQLPVGARIAVIAFNSTGGSHFSGSHVDQVVGDMLTTALRKAGVRVIERLQLDAILREQNLAREGILDPATAVPAGKVLGAEYLLGVKATEFGVKDNRVGGAVGWGPLGGLQIRKSTARVVLDMRLLDARTGSVLLTETAQGKSVNRGGTLFGGTVLGGIALGGIDIGSREWAESSLGKASRQAVDGLVKKIVGAVNNSPMARDGSVLAALPNGEVIVSLGSFDGLRAGDLLDAARVTVVRDSKGAVVWTEERPLGPLRVIEVRGDRAKAAAIDAGVAFVEGDRVRTRGANTH